MQEQLQSKFSGLAIAGLVCAILGATPFFGIIFAVVGFIFGLIALKSINRSRARLQGKGMAIAAISVGATATVLWSFIIVTMLIPSFVMTKEKAKKTSTLANIATIKMALKMYEFESGYYPKDLSELLHNKYLEEMPKDAWGKDFVYRVEPSKGIELFSLGPDGIEGTDDDVIE